MGIVTALIGLLEAGLKIWELKESRKYIDKLLEIKRAYYEEFNKPLSERSDAVLDNLRFELRLITIAVTDDIGIKNTPNLNPSGGV